MSIVKRLGNILKSHIGSLDLFDEKGRLDDIPINPTNQVKEDLTKDPTALRYYSNLELPYGASMKEIKKSYLKLLKQYHPDLHHADKEKREIAQKITTQLNEAYTFFKNNGSYQA